MDKLKPITVGPSLRIDNLEKFLEKEPSQVTFHQPGKKFDPKTDLIIRPSQNLLQEEIQWTPLLKKDQLEALRSIAEQEKISIPELVRNALDKFIQEKSTKNPMS